MGGSGMDLRREGEFFGLFAGSNAPLIITYWYEKKIFRIFIVQPNAPFGELDPLKNIG
jgi:hypothetical protein